MKSEEDCASVCVCMSVCGGVGDVQFSQCCYNYNTTTLQLLGITARAADTDGNQSSRSLHALHASEWLLSKHLQLPPACTKTREAN